MDGATDGADKGVLHIPFCMLSNLPPTINVEPDRDPVPKQRMVQTRPSGSM